MIKNDTDKGHVTAMIIHTSNQKRLKVGVEPDNYNGEGSKWSKMWASGKCRTKTYSTKRIDGGSKIAEKGRF